MTQGTNNKTGTGAGFYRGLAAFLEWIHIGLLFATFYPVAYMILIDRDDRMILPVFLAGFVILLPAAGAKIAIRLVKSFLLYLLVCVLLAVLTFWASAWIGRAFGFSRDMMTGYRICILTETIIVMIELICIRLRENRRAKALRENDIAWREQDYLLEKPIFPVLAWFVILYLIAANYDCRTGCDIAVVCFFLYAAAFILDKYLNKTEQYIGLMSYVKQFPARRIRRIGIGVVLTFLLTAGIIALIPAAATAGYRTYRDIRKWVREIEVSGAYEWFDDPMPLQYYDDPFDTLLKGEKNQPAPEWMDQLTIAIGMILLTGVGFVAIRIFWRFCADFRDTQEENGDISVSLDEDIIEKLGRTPRIGRVARSERDRIRRRYKREIRRRRKDRPAPSETPTQIETAAGIAGTQEGQELHAAYEKARYD